MWSWKNLQLQPQSLCLRVTKKSMHSMVATWQLGNLHCVDVMVSVTNPIVTPYQLISYYKSLSLITNLHTIISFNFNYLPLLCYTNQITYPWLLQSPLLELSKLLYDMLLHLPCIFSYACLYIAYIYIGLFVNNYMLMLQIKLHKLYHVSFSFIASTILYITAVYSTG